MSEPIEVQLSKLSPKPGDVLVLKVSSGELSDLAGVASALVAKTGCFVVGLHEGQMLSQVDERIMNANGWYSYRKPPPEGYTLNTCTMVAGERIESGQLIAVDAKTGKAMVSDWEKPTLDAKWHTSNASPIDDLKAMAK